MQPLPKQVQLIEQAPGEVLPSWLALEQHQLELVSRLSDAGLACIAVGKIDQEAMLIGNLSVRKGVRYQVEASLPGQIGLLRPDWPGEVVVRAAASDSFSRRQLGVPVAASLDRLGEAVAHAQRAGFRVRGRVACAFGCPYEGEIPPQAVAMVAAELYDLGCDSITLADATGGGTPGLVRRAVDATARLVPEKKLGVKLMDSYGLGLVNLLGAMLSGVTVVECAVGGVLPNPFVRGCAGTLASEDVVYLLEGLGVRTGVDLERLASAGRFLAAVTGLPSRSKTAQALSALLDQT